MLNYLYAILTLILILIFAPLRNHFSQIIILSLILNILVIVITCSHFVIYSIGQYNVYNKAILPILDKSD